MNPDFQACFMSVRGLLCVHITQCGVIVESYLNHVQIYRQPFVKMSRSMLLVFLFVILIITSQFEWKQQLVPEVHTRVNSQKQQQISTREEAVKEKVICPLQLHHQPYRFLLNELMLYDGLN